MSEIIVVKLFVVVGRLRRNLGNIKWGTIVPTRLWFVFWYAYAVHPSYKNQKPKTKNQNQKPKTKSDDDKSDVAKLAKSEM